MFNIVNEEVLEKIDRVAKKYGYFDAFDMLRDYSWSPTVLTPRHKKHELVRLLIQNGIKNKKELFGRKKK